MAAGKYRCPRPRFLQQYHLLKYSVLWFRRLYMTFDSRHFRVLTYRKKDIRLMRNLFWGEVNKHLKKCIWAAEDTHTHAPRKTTWSRARAHPLISRALWIASCFHALSLQSIFLSQKEGVAHVRNSFQGNMSSGIYALWGHLLSSQYDSRPSLNCRKTHLVNVLHHH